MEPLEDRRLLTIFGLMWSDADGNGRRDAGEPGQAGVTVYLDLNDNGLLDGTEPRTVSLSDDPATADVDETGSYAFTGIAPGIYTVAQIVPDGWNQTSPPVNPPAIQRVNLTSTGGQTTDGQTYRPKISADGRYVAFMSTSSNLTPGDTLGYQDAFVYDRQTGQVEIVSRGLNGAQANGTTEVPFPSADGRFVAFKSAASNLVPNDTNVRPDIFVYDRSTGVTERVSLPWDYATNPAHPQSNGDVGPPTITADGRYVAFASAASNLVPNDTNGVSDVFVYDRQTGSVERVSVGGDGVWTGIQANGDSAHGWISADGRFVAYDSVASNLVSGDNNLSSDVFVYNRTDGTVQRVSVRGDGSEQTGASDFPTITSDGRFVTFVSAATLAPDDTGTVVDAYVYDRLSQTIDRVSVSSTGVQSNGRSRWEPAISDDGRYVTFESFGSNLDPRDPDSVHDVFLYDRQTKTIQLVNLSAGGVEGNNWSGLPMISADGRILAFHSGSSNLVGGDTNTLADVFATANPRAWNKHIVKVGPDAVGGIDFGNSRPLTLSIVPAAFAENAGQGAATGTVTRSGDLSQALTLSLASSDVTEAAAATAVTIPADQASATFSIDAIDDVLVDGPQAVTITAWSERPAVFDPGFNGDGFVSVPFDDTSTGSQTAIAVQPDGKIVVAGSWGSNTWRVVRYMPDGLLDTSFGSGGIATTTMTTTTSYPAAYAVAIQPDGKILVGGKNVVGTGTGLLARYNANGTLDTGFASSGIYADSFGWIEDVDVRNDGYILLSLSVNGTIDLRLHLLTPAGSHAGFIAAGQNVPINAVAAAFLADNSIIVGGYKSVAKLGPSGGLDASFGSGGVVQLTLLDGTPADVGDLALDDNGRIVVAASYRRVPTGNLKHDFGVARLLADGSHDPSFGNGQGVVTPLSGFDTAYARAIQIQDDGRIVVGGAAYRTQTDRVPALIRYTEDGSLDSSFFGDGIQLGMPDPTTNGVVFDLDKQPDGAIVGVASFGPSPGAFRINTGTAASASANLTVNDNDANSAPIAVNDTYFADEDTLLDTPLPGVLGNDTDVDGDPLTSVLVSGPSHGSLTLNADGAFTYTPDPEFNGADSFTYKANDGRLDSNVATVSITVNAVNDAPAANGQAVALNEDGSKGIVLTGSDIDGDVLTFTVVAGPAHGTLSGVAPSLLYTPAANYHGDDSFTFKVSDGAVDSDAAAVTIAVAPVNDAPVVRVSGPASALPGQSCIFTFEAGDPLDGNPVGQRFSYSITWDDGTREIVSGGSRIDVQHDVVITRPSGTYTVTATVTDEAGSGLTSAPASSSIEVHGAGIQGGDLVVVGTSASDSIQVEPADSSGSLAVYIAGQSQGVFHPTGWVNVYALAGDDVVQVRSAKIGKKTVYVTVPAAIFGADGVDVLDVLGSKASNILVGGDGGDSITANSGRDLLFGGPGVDALRGGSGEDVLVAGPSAYDADLAALRAIWDEWTRSDVGYSPRVGHLTGTIAGGRNEGHFLTASTVFDDAAVDRLFGASGTDWFFCRSGGDFSDVLDRKRSEEVTLI